VSAAKRLDRDIFSIRVSSEARYDLRLSSADGRD
jgi:hypothetical protein